MNNLPQNVYSQKDGYPMPRQLYDTLLSSDHGPHIEIAAGFYLFNMQYVTSCVKSAFHTATFTAGNLISLSKGDDSEHA